MTKYRLKLYNTESRQQEEIIPIDGRTIRMYTCGPTVYNFAHIGNFRTYVFEDLLRRTIKFFGLPVRQAMNLTDVDDKTIKGAIENKVSLAAFTQTFKDAFFQDLKTLNIEPVEYYPQATDYIPEMITIIQKLLDTGVAYRGQDGSIYFSIAKFPSYGRLSHLHLNELQVGASERVIHDEYEKDNASDFVLWKIFDPERDGDIFWDSPFGKGRPGWHIECSAMAMKLLGESIDIHVGGVDNMFPHHENEIAQSEAYSCRHFVKHWLHAEHLLVDHKKMSKSLGNFYTLRDLLKKGYTGKQVRYMLLQTHYRTQLNFTFAGLDGAVSTLERLSDFIVRLQAIRRDKDAQSSRHDPGKSPSRNSAEKTDPRTDPLRCPIGKKPRHPRSRTSRTAASALAAAYRGERTGPQTDFNRGQSGKRAHTLNADPGKKSQRASRDTKNPFQYHPRCTR